MSPQIPVQSWHTIHILIGDLILPEVLQGFLNDPDFEKARCSSGKFIQEIMATPHWQCNAQEIIASCGQRESLSLKR